MKDMPGRAVDEILHLGGRRGSGLPEQKCFHTFFQTIAIKGLTEAEMIAGRRDAAPHSLPHIHSDDNRSFKRTGAI